MKWKIMVFYLNQNETEALNSKINPSEIDFKKLHG
jgi:hypothetical protein